MKDWTGNKTSVWKILAASNYSDSEREQNDYYATDPIAIDKLQGGLCLSSNIWECAAGEGYLSRRLSEFNHEVYSSDIVERGFKLDKVLDFLTATPLDIPFTGIFDIVTNPPYKYATEFVIKALDLLPLGGKCCMFLKLTFLEGKRRYADLFKNNPPRMVFVFSERIICAKNGAFDYVRNTGGSAVAYAWFVWQKGYTGETIVKWI